MNIFIGCSSSNSIKDEYKVVTKYLAETLSKNNDLIFGSENKGLMGICYNEFKKNNRKVTGICYEMYKDDLNDLELDEVYMVSSLEESNKLLEEKSDIIIFLPGSFGTLSEFICMLEEKRTNLHNKEMLIFNINGFYNDLINMFDTINKRVSTDYDFYKLCKVFSSVDEINNYIESIKE